MLLLLRLLRGHEGLPEGIASFCSVLQTPKAATPETERIVMSSSAWRAPSREQEVMWQRFAVNNGLSPAAELLGAYSCRVVFSPQLATLCLRDGCSRRGRQRSRRHASIKVHGQLLLSATHIALQSVRSSGSSRKMIGTAAPLGAVQRIQVLNKRLVSCHAPTAIVFFKRQGSGGKPLVMQLHICQEGAQLLCDLFRAHHRCCSAQRPESDEMEDMTVDDDVVRNEMELQCSGARDEVARSESAYSFVLHRALPGPTKQHLQDGFMPEEQMTSLLYGEVEHFRFDEEVAICTPAEQRLGPYSP